MKINKIFIKKYKNIENQLVEFSESKSNVHILIGKNGSGKSNYLEAISIIFSKLFQNTLENNFPFTIEYEIYGSKVFVDFSDKLQIKVNNEEVRYDYILSNELLPDRIITIYSGDELRMWETIYKPFYTNYLASIFKGESSSLFLKLLYISKIHWSISLLTLAVSEDPNCISFLNELGYKIDSVMFEYDESNIKKNKDFKLNILVTKLLEKNNYTIPELRSIFKILAFSSDSDEFQLNDSEVFEYFLKSSIPDDFKLISKIKLNINNQMSLNDLSEGEKKRILVFVAIHILASQNSIVLLDEPDTFLHPSWQKNLINFIDSISINNFILLTTHSPNVLSSSDSNNIFKLDSGSIINRFYSVWGKDINTIQTEFLDEHFRDYSAEEQLKDIYNMISTRNLEEASKALDDLVENRFDPNDFEILKLRTLLEFEREFND